MSRSELPPVLRAGPFAVGQAWDAGLRPCDLRRRGLHRPTHAVRTTAVPRTLVDRARAFAAALPDDAAFSHGTAAQLLGLPVPRHLEAGELLHVMRPSWRVPTRRAGCVGHRGLESRAVMHRHGLLVVSPADTWCDLADGPIPGPGVDDLVVVGDAVVARSAVADPVGALRATLERRVRPRGKALLTEALGLVRPRVRSPMETRARLMFVRAGFPEPEVNAVVHDRHGGWLLEGDLVWRRQRVVGEYQGSDHSSRLRRSADGHRAGLARDEGWTVLELFAEDVEPGPRHRTTLLRFARELTLDPRSLRVD